MGIVAEFVIHIFNTSVIYYFQHLGDMHDSITKERSDALEEFIICAEKSDLVKY